MSWSIWAAITKYHTIGGLCTTEIYFYSFETGKSKIRVLANSVSNKSLISSRKGATLLCVHMVEGTS